MESRQTGKVKKTDMFENRMAIGSEWKTIDPPEASESRADAPGPLCAGKKTDGPGYREIGTGEFVPKEDAFDYAIENCMEMIPNWLHRIEWTEEFRKMLVEWFYSGDWIEED